MERVTLSLVSHTNVGKTTLARTLLKRDVGEVLDQAHVTEISEAYILIATGDRELRLWDTPGFGDSVRLLRRLRRHESPVLWFFQQTWDRITDRALWCSQQAALNIRDEADVVLYLVNATEEPEEAGYVVPELELLDWIGRPVVLLLNQTGGGEVAPEAQAARVESWRHYADRWPAVGEVLALDAFSRFWVQESLLFERVGSLLPAERRQAMEALTSAWNRRNDEVFERAVSAMARYLQEAAADRQELASRKPSRDDKQRGMEALAQRLKQATEALMSTLLELHGLEGTAGAEIDRQIDAVAVDGEDLLDPEKGAFWGGVLSGAAGGLTADLLAGGLSFGGGMLAGAILGALGGAGLARGFQLIKGKKLPEVRWSLPFLERLTSQILLRYLMVAHFGRGRGEFKDQEASHRWQTLAAGALRRYAESWSTAMGDAGAGEPTPHRLQQVLDETLRSILAEGYPEAAKWLVVEELSNSSSEQATG